MARIIRRPKEDSEEYPGPPPPVQEELPLVGLRMGDSSRGVAVLQLRLGVAATGSYDALTEYVVKRTQEDLRLMPTGVADPVLHGRLGLPWPPLEN